MAESSAKPNDPPIISGGMGVRISWWPLARIVALMDGIGVVSGTALEIVHARVLQDGDPGGHVRQAFTELARLQPALSETITHLLKKYFIEGGRPAKQAYRPVPTWNLTRIEGRGTPPDSFWTAARDLQVLNLAANFAEVWLAKQGHKGMVGINYLRKIERPIPWALYGAMLAGANYVIVGAGSPPEIPGLIRHLSRHEPVSMALKVAGATSTSGTFSTYLEPRALVGPDAAPLPEPKFLAIVASAELARALAGDPETRPYGFVIEGPQAGGHSAPPAIKRFDAEGKPVLVYTESDRADIGAIAELGLPFWLAGAYASVERLREARALGAAGVQLGTIAALSGQSGMEPALRMKILDLLSRNQLGVAADALISPTGFPFKVAQVPGTLSDPAVYGTRKRICDVAQLQAAYMKPDGSLGFRCPSEPVQDFLRKGGREKNTVGRACLCNGLLATAGLAQVRPDGYVEPPVVTLGEDLSAARQMLEGLPEGQQSYSVGKALHSMKELPETNSSEQA